MEINTTTQTGEFPTTLTLFCRRPTTGSGKRRIAREWGNALTLELAHHLLATTLEDAHDWPGPVAIAPAEATDERWANNLLRKPVIVVPQPAGNLGERINAVDRALRERGHNSLVYIGSDAPALTPGYYTRARNALDEADVVLGPACDGGVTLMGANVPWPDLEALPWSSDRLGDALRCACTDRGLRIAELERQYDIDVGGDLVRLHDDLTHDERPARRALRDWLGRQQLQRSA